MKRSLSFQFGEKLINLEGGYCFGLPSNVFSIRRIFNQSHPNSWEAKFYHAAPRIRTSRVLAQSVVERVASLTQWKIWVSQHPTFLQIKTSWPWQRIFQRRDLEQECPSLPWWRIMHTPLTSQLDQLQVIFLIYYRTICWMNLAHWGEPWRSRCQQWKWEFCSENPPGCNDGETSISRLKWGYSPLTNASSVMPRAYLTVSKLGELFAPNK